MRRPIVGIVLASFEQGSSKLQLVYERRDEPDGCIGVRDLSASKTCWFNSYDVAHELYVALCELAGRPTFRSVARAT